MVDVVDFKRKEEKPLNTYEVKNREGEIVTYVQAHVIGIDIDAEQVMFIHDNEELLALVPFGLIVTKKTD